MVRRSYTMVLLLLSPLLLLRPDVLFAQEPELLAAPHLSVGDATPHPVSAPSLLHEALRVVALTRDCPTTNNQEPSWLAEVRIMSWERCVPFSPGERPRDVSQRFGGSIRDNHAMTYTPDWEGFRRDLVMQGAINLNILGLLFILPESMTSWTPEQKRAGNYWTNLSKGPHLDPDDWATNYIDHPLAGSQYFLTARRRGFGWKGALFYSSLASTFGWEMGVEAFYEQPSVQDLWATPVFGTIMGEYMLRLHHRLFEDRFLGSRVLRIVLLGVMDPAGSLSRWLDGEGINFFVSPDGLTLSW
jgi:uncharacterized protein DUF3943